MNLKDLKGMKVPSAMIKKLFPPKKCLYTVDTNGDGKADSVKIVALNILAPFAIPERKDLGEIKIDDIDPSEYGKLILNGEEIDISKSSPNIDLIKKSLRVYHKGQSFSFNDALSGKMSGRTIAMGDEMVIVFKLAESFLAKLTLGKHTLAIQSDKVPSIEIGFELTKENINQKFTL
jgi:hypothetical protein